VLGVVRRLVMRPPTCRQAHSWWRAGAKRLVWGSASAPAVTERRTVCAAWHELRSGNRQQACGQARGNSQGQRQIAPRLQLGRQPLAQRELGAGRSKAPPERIQAGEPITARLLAGGNDLQAEVPPIGQAQGLTRELRRLRRRAIMRPAARQHRSAQCAGQPIARHWALARGHGVRARRATAAPAATARPASRQPSLFQDDAGM
jgi:hypothetical protein